MDQLLEKFRNKLRLVPVTFIRSLMDDIDWSVRMIGIKGARGVGKTTLMLQHIKQYREPDESVLYVSLDDIWFSDNRLTELAGHFVKRGGRYLYLDEVHRYANWSRELKNIYDDYPELNVVFTGSSLLEILNARADLSRRAAVYTMQGLSFREFLNYSAGTSFPVFSLDEILNDSNRISDQVLEMLRPLQYFEGYLEAGYYPFYKESPGLYHSRIGEIVNMIIEIELPLLRGVDMTYSDKLKRLLLVISETAPFIPNISKLSSRIGINRNTLVNYLHYLQEAGIIQNLYKDTKGISRLQKPDKIFLDNTNIAFAVNSNIPDKGMLRETFFANQMSWKHTVSIPKHGDFLVDDKYLFEIGGKNKSDVQIDGNGYVAIDDVEYGFQNRIPLWLFGFLY